MTDPPVEYNQECSNSHWNLITYQIFEYLESSINLNVIIFQLYPIIFSILFSLIKN